MSDDSDTDTHPQTRFATPLREHCVCPDCGCGWTFDFQQRRVYCRQCESATAADAVDPSVTDTGKPTTRASSVPANISGQPSDEQKEGK